MPSALQQMGDALHDEQHGRPISDLAVFFLLPVLYYLGARFGSSYTVMPEGLAVIWASNSVVLAALLLTRGRYLAPFAAMVVAAEVAADLPVIPIREALLYGAVNMAEAWLVYALLRRWRFDWRFTALSDVTKFVLAGPLIGALGAAIVGGALFRLFFGIETSYPEFVRVWWFGDGLGLMIFTPLLLGCCPVADAPRRPSTLSLVDVGVGLLALAALGLLVVSRKGMLGGIHVGPVMLLPFIIYMAARFEARWVAAAIAVVALVTVVMITRGNNPFGSLPGYDAVVHAQEFIFIMSLLGLGFNALVSELSLRQREIEAANRHLNTLNHDLEARIVARTAELHALNARLARQALTDVLTGVMNRRGFMEVAAGQIEHARRHDNPLALLILDIDHFKVVNDSYGHQAGDEVIRYVAATLGAALRPDDTLARYGGEEFVILAPQTDFAGALALGARILGLVRATPIPVAGHAITLTASLGLSARCAGDDDLEQLLRRADEALYAAKAAGRDCLAVAAPGQAPRVV